MEQYVLIIGPHDTCFVGPFYGGKASINGWLDKQEIKGRNVAFDFFPMTKEDMQKNLNDFGPCTTYTPEQWEAE